MCEKNMVCAHAFNGDCDKECSFAKRHEFYNNEPGDEYGCNGFKCPFDDAKECHCVDTKVYGVASNE